MFSGKKPVVNGGSGAADMEISRGTGWKTDTYVLHDFSSVIGGVWGNGFAQRENEPPWLVRRLYEFFKSFSMDFQEEPCIL